MNAFLAAAGGEVVTHWAIVDSMAFTATGVGSDVATRELIDGSYERLVPEGRFAKVLAASRAAGDSMLMYVNSRALVSLGDPLELVVGLGFDAGVTRLRFSLVHPR